MIRRFIQSSIFLLLFTIGAQSQEIKTYNYDELKSRLETQNDTTYIVNFWATWCKPCVDEMPEFVRFMKDHNGQKVKLLLVSLDFPNNAEKKLKAFIKEHNIKSEVVLLDDSRANYWINDISIEWSGSIPATLVFTNNTRSFHEGKYTYEDLKTVTNLK